MKRIQRVAIGTVLAAGLTAGCGLAAGGRQVTPDVSVSAHHSPGAETTLYLPTWLSPNEYKRLAALPLHAAGVDVVLAFAEPTPESLAAPNIPDGAVQVIGKLSADANVSVAIGGYGDANSRQGILDGFDAQSAQPDNFADQVSALAGEVGHRLGRPVNGVDLDWEYPPANKSADLAAMLEALDAKLPNARLSIAVPAADNLDGFTGAMAAIADHVDVVHVMTYDQTTPYLIPRKTAGPVASRDWMLTSFQAWQRRITDAGGKAQVALGFPGYCYTYQGAQRPGELYTAGSQTPLAKVNPSILTQQADGSSAFAAANGWTSCFSAEDVKQVVADLPDTKVPMFVWSAEGVDAAYLNTLTDR